MYSSSASCTITGSSFVAAEGVWDTKQADVQVRSHRVGRSLQSHHKWVVQLQRKSLKLPVWGHLITFLNAESQLQSACSTWVHQIYQCQGCWAVDSASLFPTFPVPPMNRGPSKALQLRAFSQLQDTARISIHRCQSANPLLCCSERVDSAQGPVMQATALLCMGGVIRGLRFRAHFSDSSGWPDYFSLVCVCVCDDCTSVAPSPVVSLLIIDHL